MEPWGHLDAFRCSFHGSGHRGGICFGLDDALRALVPIRDLNGQGEESVRAWLGWSPHGLVSSMLFGAVLGWNVTFVRKCLSDGLSWVGPDELSGLACKSA